MANIPRRIKRFLPKPKRPHLFSYEGIVMLFIALFFEAINILLALLDVAIVTMILGPIFNALGMVIIGGWLIIRTGTIPKRKILFPFLANSLPIIKILPFYWTYTVYSSLDRSFGGESSQQQAPQQPQPQSI